MLASVRLAGNYSTNDGNHTLVNQSLSNGERAGVMNTDAVASEMARPISREDPMSTLNQGDKAIKVPAV